MRLLFAPPLLCLLPLSAAALGPTVGLLVDHTPMTCGASGSLETVLCNLEVYEATIAQAAAASATAKVDLLILPEAYGLSAGVKKAGHWEPLYLTNTTATTTACAEADNATMPVQKAISCLARKYGVAIAYNLFAQRGGANRITEIVVDAAGGLRATYDKVHLFPITEKAGGATPGTNAPVTFNLLGRKWGIIICYEGLYPYVPGGNFKQMDALYADNATTWIWSIGSDIPISTIAKKLVVKYSGVFVAATQDHSIMGKGVITCGSSGAGCAYVDVTLDAAKLPDGYTGKPFLRTAVLP